MMNIPTEDIKLPEDISRALENARNNVTILEAESKRLNGIIESQNYTIGELNKEKVYLDNTILELKNTIHDGVKELDELGKQSSVISSNLVKLNERAKELIEEKEKFDKEYVEKQNKLFDFENKMNKKEKELFERESILNEKEEDLKQKLVKIDKLKESI